MNRIKKAIAVSIVSVLCLGTVFTAKSEVPANTNDMTASAAESLTLSDLPDDYQYATDWIWNNRITAEDSTGTKAKRYNSIFDQIIDGRGTINYVVRWQSYRTVTLEQRKQFETMLSQGINDWAKWLSGYEDWPYDHIDVNVVGWAVIDKSCLLDLQPDEIVYTDTEYYDSKNDTSNGTETIPDRLPNAPSELSRMDHFFDKNYEYPGGLDKRFDMYMWATQGFPAIGGCGGDWGQRLSDVAYLNMIDGTGIHVFEHELGHGFGMTDFYGGEGASDGFPPGGFPGNGTSLMMAGSSAEITDFDGWMLRYMWSNIKNDPDRFDLSSLPQNPDNTETTTTTTTTAASETTITTTTTTSEPFVPGEGEQLPITYDNSNKRWLVDTNNNSHITIQVKGLPYAGVSGTYGYWINNSAVWEQSSWSMPESLGPEGVGTFTVDIPEDKSTSQIQIKVNYYAQWDNDANDMVDRDKTSLEFTAIGSGKTQSSETTVTTVTTTTTETTTKTAEIIFGDVNDDKAISVADIIMMQKYLLGIDKMTLMSAGDLTKDNIINILDLCALKEMVFNK